ncbi:MAG: 3-hydroxyacyl-CoA dehydrogenase/enoyl-CoA hydratase family protein, partial [Rhizobacter sp.]|nr:3-hydroxyacyl-CoA dehydrogenase/enoyl-CoA hydratase family protein [Chlorobiales bacterium]
MNRIIKQVAVLGSGVMGSRIALHFAGIGVKVLLLDIVPKELTAEEQVAGKTLQQKSVRNRIVDAALQAAIKSNPSPVYFKDAAKQVSTGNFDDNMPQIKDADWVIEVVVENLEIKKKVYDQVEQHRKAGTIVSSNTSGIPIRLMAEGRSDDFQKHFCGTHFFNPPRYLKLLEIIPAPKTDPELVGFLMHYGDLHLGKTTVLCKDTPAFIANRVGVFGIMSTFRAMEKLGMGIDEVDKITGPVVGRPKSATFRTSDVVGLDTLIHVSNNLYAELLSDTAREVFKLPDFLSQMSANKWLGDKTGQGFYKKIKGEKGSEILTLDLNTLEYGEKKKVKFATLEVTKGVDDLRQRLKAFAASKDKAGEFFRLTMDDVFEYVANRIPEISDDLYRIDLAMTSGFGWELGPFEVWDAIGVARTVERMEAEGRKIAKWVCGMIEGGHKNFYEVKDGMKCYYDITSKSYKPIPGLDEFIVLDALRGSKAVMKNQGASAVDLGDGVLCVEFHSKMNAIGSDTLSMISRTIEKAESEGWRGVVIGNQAPNFSAGANLALMLMAAMEQEFDELDLIIRQFQSTVMRIRYSSIPVIVAPHGLTLGGGCEMTLHADRIQAAAETYIGLVEFGVGLIPAGGGSKELAMRAADAVLEGDIELIALRNNFMKIANAKVATSAFEAKELGLFQRGDKISINKDRQILDAKNLVLELAEAGYRQPAPRHDVRVLGREGLGVIYAGANSMRAGGYISEYDEKICQKLGFVMCGGDLTSATEVSEQYLLDLEREAFLSLLGERKTLERIQTMLTTGKPLRN